MVLCHGSPSSGLNQFRFKAPFGTFSRTAWPPEATAQALPGLGGIRSFSLLSFALNPAFLPPGGRHTPSARPSRPAAPSLRPGRGAAGREQRPAWKRQELLGAACGQAFSGATPSVSRAAVPAVPRRPSRAGAGAGFPPPGVGAGVSRGCCANCPGGIPTLPLTSR